MVVEGAVAVQVVPREEIEFRVVSAQGPTIEGMVREERSDLEQGVGSAGDESPLDIQARYTATQSDVQTAYVSYDSPHREDVAQVSSATSYARDAQEDAAKQESVIEEIGMRKVHDVAGVSFDARYAGGIDEQIQIEWYKQVNRFYIMVLYDAV